MSADADLSNREALASLAALMRRVGAGLQATGAELVRVAQGIEVALNNTEE